MNKLLTIQELIGHFHPVLVHLPIGILLVAVLLYWLSARPQQASLKAAIPVVLFWGMLSAIASAISGLLLAQSGDYDPSLVSTHQWMGIATVIVSIGVYWFHKRGSIHVKWAMPLMAIGIVVTGHFGGSLTHGEGYLTEALRSKAATNIAVKPIADVQNAVAYSDVVQPLLQAGCYSCHGPNKSKGNLRLDDPSFIAKGGKSGKTIVPGNITESELIRRILLPIDHEEHMPPRQKPQLAASQIELLSWWVSAGADYHKKIAALNQPPKIKPILAALQNGGTSTETALQDIPQASIEEAPQQVLNALKSMEVSVNEVAKNSHYLSVNFVACKSITAKHLDLLRQLNKHIIWLKLGNSVLSDSVLSVVGSLPHLTRLYLNNSNMNDQLLAKLKDQQNLQYLNLSGTAVTANGVAALQGLKHLQQLYLYQSAINAAGWIQLKQAFPGALIDKGGYKIERLATDTAEVKAIATK